LRRREYRGDPIAFLFLSLGHHIALLSSLALGIGIVAYCIGFYQDLSSTSSSHILIGLFLIHLIISPLCLSVCFAGAQQYSLLLIVAHAFHVFRTFLRPVCLSATNPPLPAFASTYPSFNLLYQQPLLDWTTSTGIPLFPFLSRHIYPIRRRGSHPASASSPPVSRGTSSLAPVRSGYSVPLPGKCDI